jgi:hypothetical protein
MGQASYLTGGSQTRSRWRSQACPLKHCEVAPPELHPTLMARTATDWLRQVETLANIAKAMTLDEKDITKSGQWTINEH